ncbi:hypothetical protein ACVIRM_005573 [Rhizobium laguerreae]
MREVSKRMQDQDCFSALFCRKLTEVSFSSPGDYLLPESYYIKLVIVAARQTYIQTVISDPSGFALMEYSPPFLKLRTVAKVSSINCT